MYYYALTSATMFYIFLQVIAFLKNIWPQPQLCQTNYPNVGLDKEIGPLVVTASELVAAVIMLNCAVQIVGNMLALMNSLALLNALAGACGNRRWSWTRRWSTATSVLLFAMGASIVPKRRAMIKLRLAALEVGTLLPFTRAWAVTMGRPGTNGLGYFRLSNRRNGQEGKDGEKNNKLHDLFELSAVSV